MASAQDVLGLMATLPADEQQKVQTVMSLGPPPKAYVGAIWLIVVISFAVLLVGGVAGIATMTYLGKDPKDFLPLVTGALGVLAGLLAPSPVSGN